MRRRELFVAAALAAGTLVGAGACGGATTGNGGGSGAQCLSGMGECIASGAQCTGSAVVGQDACPSGEVCCDHEGIGEAGGPPDASNGGSCGAPGFAECVPMGARCDRPVGQQTCAAGYTCCHTEGIDSGTDSGPPGDSSPPLDADASENAPIACEGGVPPPVPCGPTACDPALQYCEVGYSPIATDAGPSYRCQPFPAGCACGCECIGMSNNAPNPGDCGCYASPNGQVTVGFCPP